MRLYRVEGPFLAYVLWKKLASGCSAAAWGDAPRPLIDELAKMKSGDVVLAPQAANGRSDRVVRQ